MRTDSIDYPIPSDAIAQRPPSERGRSRLLIVEEASLTDSSMLEWPELVPKDALVVLNDTRVLKARLIGRLAPGDAPVELLLLEPYRAEPLVAEIAPALEAQRADSSSRGVRSVSSRTWWALGRSKRKFDAGARIHLGDDYLDVVERVADGRLIVEKPAGMTIEDLLERSGHVPLPPYVRRSADLDDETRYQTVFARKAGAVAAPTAGLHLTSDMLHRLEARGVRVASLTLHVGAGTFAPVRVADLTHHPMHAEHFEVGHDLVHQVSEARRRGGPVVAVGTTVVRALESASVAGEPGVIGAVQGSTRLLIQPGYAFNVVDALLTNFHAPRTTLMALVAAFAGLERVQRAYRAALERGYRFLSYGDAMWLPGRLN